MKIASVSNNSISLITFQENFSTLLTNQISQYDTDLGSSNIIIKKLLNNSLTFLVQDNHNVIWKNFANIVVSSEPTSSNMLRIFKQSLLFNNDNVSDIFSISFENGRIMNFIVQDGSNLSSTLVNISIASLNTNYFITDYLIGFFNSSLNSNNMTLQQILFINKNNYFKINNNGQFDNPLLNVNSVSGLTIQYCSSVIFILRWSIIPNKTIISYVYTDNSIYFTNKEQNISLIMNNNNNLNLPFKKSYTIESISESNTHAFDSISITFVPNSCGSLTFNTSTSNIVEGFFSGVKIPDLSAIISMTFLVSVLSLIVIYSKDHKKL